MNGMLIAQRRTSMGAPHRPERPVREIVQEFSQLIEPVVPGLGRIVMGQGPVRLRIVVLDRRGHPMSGVVATVWVDHEFQNPDDPNLSMEIESIGQGITDADGAVIVSVPTFKKIADVRVQLPEGDLVKRVNLVQSGMQTVTFNSIRKSEDPIVTLFEASAMSAGVGLILTGILIGKTVGTVLEGIGGSLTFASAYSAISRRV